MAENKRPNLIDIFFAIIVSIGLQTLLDKSTEFDRGPGSWLLTLIFFLASFMWIITYWVSYHLLIDLRSYIQTSKLFFIDITSFSAMFLILSAPSFFLSFEGQPISSLPIFIFLFSLLHCLNYAWYKDILKDLQSRNDYETIELIGLVKDVKIECFMFIFLLSIGVISVTVPIFLPWIYPAYITSLFGISIYFTVMGLIMWFIIARLRKYLPFVHNEQIGGSLRFKPILLNPEDKTPVFHRGHRQLCYWYQVEVTNYRRDRIATNCVTYLSSYRDLLTDNDTRPPYAPFKWAGITSKEVDIAPLNSNLFDGFFIIDNPQESQKVHLGINESIIDFSGLIQEYILSGMDYELNFALASSNYPLIQQTLILHRKGPRDSILHSVESKKECPHCLRKSVR